MSGEVLVLPLGAGPNLPLLDSRSTGEATATVWPGMGATARSIVWIRLQPRSSTLEFRHPGEAVYFVRAGSGAVVGATPGGAARSTPSMHKLSAGTVVHVAPGSPYRFRSGTTSDGLDLVGGPCPPDPSWFPTFWDDKPGKTGVGTRPTLEASVHDGHDGTVPDVEAIGAQGVQVLSSEEPALMLPLISSDARMIAWPGNGAWDATMNYVRMEPGEENTEHAHAHSEDTIMILEGHGSVDDLSAGQTLEFAAGDVIHVPARVRHAVRANRGSPVVSVGGPCPADIAFLRRCGADISDRRSERRLQLESSHE